MLTLEDAAHLPARAKADRPRVDDRWFAHDPETAASRNGNLKIEGPRGTGLLIKQPVDPAHRGRETLGSEAAFYRFCQEEPAASAMAKVVPRLVYHDDERCVLALRLVPEALTLSNSSPRPRSNNRRSKWPAHSVEPWPPCIGPSSAVGSLKARASRGSRASRHG